MSLLSLLNLSAKNPLLQTRLQSLLCAVLVLVLLGLLAVFGPQQIPVVAYKLVMGILGGAATGFLWLVLLPYANPARYLKYNWREDPEVDKPGEADFAIVPGYAGVFCTCTASLTAAICAGVLAVNLGL